MRTKSHSTSFRKVKVGDKADRMIGDGKFWMEMLVVAVDDDFIYCDNAKDRPLQGYAIDQHWKFSRDNGAEEDEDLGWGNKFGVTGSYLNPKEEKGDPNHRT